MALAVLSTSGLVEAGTITWTVAITPKGGGTVVWRTSSPVASGTLTNSGTLKLDLNAWVEFCP